MKIEMSGSGSGNGVPAAQGAVAIGSGSSSVVVTFTTPFASNNYALAVSFVNTTDGTPITLAGKVTSKSTTGFTFSLDAPTDSANYTLSYLAANNV